MGDTFLKAAVLISVVLLPPVVVSQGLGEVVVLAPEAATQITGQYTSYTNATDIDAAVTATELTAQTAVDLKAVLSQTNAPAKVYVATYDDSTETPDDAMDRIIADVDIGVAALTSRTTSDLAAMGTWLASGDRRWRYHVIAQSAEASLITASPTASLDTCQVSSFHLHYHPTDAQPQAAAHAGRLAGHALVSGPIAARATLLGVTLPSLTTAEQGFAEANNVNVLYAADKGAAQDLILFGRNNYNGDSFKAVVTSIYTVRRLTAAMKTLLTSHALLAKPIPATEDGAALVEATLNGPLGQMAEADHYAPGTSGTGASAVSLPDGYRIVTSVVDDDINAAVQIRLGREVHQFNIDITGEVI